MRAVRIHAHGSIGQLRYEEAPQPKLIFPEDALVKLKAASLNRLDISVRRGVNGTAVHLPRILGADGAGVVAQVGAHVKNVKPGDPVCLYPLTGCGLCEFCITDREFMCNQSRVLGQAEDGTYAQYVRVPARNCFPMPSHLGFEEGSTLPSVYLTVWRMLVTNAALKPGEQALILGIGGGTALAALRVAAQIGAAVIVTSRSDEKLARALSLGAQHAINSESADFAKEVRQLTGKRGVDLVVDCVGGKSWVKSLICLAKEGRLVTCGATAGVQARTDVRRLFWNHLRIFGSSFGSREEFRQVLSFMEVTKTKPIIDQVFSLSATITAQKRLEEGKQFGKIVLRTD